MREGPIHQAEGLGSLARCHGARLVAMICHGDEQAELPLLWHLCRTWIELGYPVTVLDGGTTESIDNPGLEQLLDCPYRSTAGEQSANEWCLLPARNGLVALCQSKPSLEGLSELLGNVACTDGVVVVYASAPILATIFQGHQLTPLLAVSTARESLLTSYQALKRIVASPLVSPLIVDQTAPSTTTEFGRSTSPARTLAECARNFLQVDLQLAQLRATRDDAPTAADLLRLALRVLENAIPLSSRWPSMASTATKIGVGQYSRSH